MLNLIPAILQPLWHCCTLIYHNSTFVVERLRQFKVGSYALLVLLENDFITGEDLAIDGGMAMRTV